MPTTFADDFSQYDEKWIVYVLKTPVANKPEGRLFCSYTNRITQRLRDHLTPKISPNVKTYSAIQERKKKSGCRTFTSIEVLWLGECSSGTQALSIAEFFTALEPAQKHKVIAGIYSLSTKMLQRISLNYERPD